METICPAPPELTTVDNPNCPENLGQIQKIFFQRQISGWTFDSTGATSAALLASWTPLLVATDDTKIVVTPYFDTGEITPGKVISVGGGDNTTLNGRKLNMDFNATEFAAQFRSIRGEIIAQLKKLEYGEVLMAYFVNQFKQIALNDLDTAHPGTKLTGFPIFSPYFEDAGNKGFATDDKANFGFSMDYGWRDNLYLLKPTWNPFTALVPTQET